MAKKPRWSDAVLQGVRKWGPTTCGDLTIKLRAAQAEIPRDPNKRKRYVTLSLVASGLDYLIRRGDIVVVPVGSTYRYQWCDWSRSVDA